MDMFWNFHVYLQDDFFYVILKKSGLFSKKVPTFTNLNHTNSFNFVKYNFNNVSMHSSFYLFSFSFSYYIYKKNNFFFENLLVKTNFWIFYFLFDFFYTRSFKKILSFFFSSVLFNKVFSYKSNLIFVFFVKLILKENKNALFLNSIKSK
jgi:hypothetical protein